MVTDSQHTLPLDDITVVAIEQAVAAPLATRVLADLGARVIKVERPDGGDFARRYDEALGGWSTFFVWLNMGKQSVTLDLKAPDGAALLGRLLDHADVFVHNLAPGAIERLGFGRACIAERWPSLIDAGVTGYGSDGPWRTKKAYDLLVQAESGLLSINGGPKEIAKVAVSVADIAAGTQLATGVLAAIVLRLRTGQSVPVEVSLFDALVEWMSVPLYQTIGTGVPPRRSGAHHPTIAPYGPYTASDGEMVVIAVQNEREWRALCIQVLDRPDLVDDPRFSNNVARVAHRSELDAVLEAYSGQRTAGELTRALEAAAIAVARVNSLVDVVSHHELSDRDRWCTATAGDTILHVLRPPLDANAFPVRGDARVVPTLGQQTDAILTELGLGVDDIANLRNSGVV